MKSFYLLDSQYELLLTFVIGKNPLWQLQTPSEQVLFAVNRRHCSEFWHLPPKATPVSKKKIN